MVIGTRLANNSKIASGWEVFYLFHHMSGRYRIHRASVDLGKRGGRLSGTLLGRDLVDSFGFALPGLRNRAFKLLIRSVA